MHRLRELRRQQERSQGELAEILEVGRTTISKLELGQQEATASQLLKIADYFNVSVDFLLECEQTKYSNEVFDILNVLECEKVFVGTHQLTENERQTLSDVIKAIFRHHL